MPRKPSKKQLKEYLKAGALAVLVLWLLFLVWGIFQKQEIARQAVKDTQAELETLKAREQVLRSNIEELETERGKEATLRANYGVAKPGEEVIIVVPGNASSTPPTLPWYKKFLGWFGVW